MAAITERVVFLVNEYNRTRRRNDKMFKTIKDLLELRNRHLAYLQKTDFNTFAHLIAEYKIPYDPEHVHSQKCHDLPRYSAGNAKYSR